MDDRRGRSRGGHASLNAGVGSWGRNSISTQKVSPAPQTLPAPPSYISTHEKRESDTTEPGK